MAKIEVKGTEITVYSHSEEDYICITDIARHKNSERTDDLIRNWIRNRNTIEFLGIWEMLNNPVSIVLPLRLNSGSSKRMQWVLFLSGTQTQRNKGNIREYADVSQLVCLANLENLNALFINEGLFQEVRLERLNQIAIQQMRILTSDSGMKRLEEKE